MGTTTGTAVEIVVWVNRYENRCMIFGPVGAGTSLVSGVEDGESLAVPGYAGRQRVIVRIEGIGMSTVEARSMLDDALKVLDSAFTIPPDDDIPF